MCPKAMCINGEVSLALDFDWQILFRQAEVEAAEDLSRHQTMKTQTKKNRLSRKQKHYFEIKHSEYNNNDELIK